MELIINTTRDFWKMCQIALASAARVQFWHIFQKSLVVLIIYCNPSGVITYTYTVVMLFCILWTFYLM